MSFLGTEQGLSVKSQRLSDRASLSRRVAGRLAPIAADRIAGVEPVVGCTRVARRGCSGPAAPRFGVATGGFQSAQVQASCLGAKEQTAILLDPTNNSLSNKAGVFPFD